MPPGRSGKNTYISRISYSVTHLKSYSNFAIANIAGNSLPSVDIAAPSAGIATASFHVYLLTANVAALSANTMHRMMSVSCFTIVSRCLVSHATIGIGAWLPACMLQSLHRQPRECQLPQGLVWHTPHGISSIPLYFPTPLIINFPSHFLITYLLSFLKFLSKLI